MKKYLSGSFYGTLLGLWILFPVLPLTASKPSSTIDNYPSLMSLCQCLVNPTERISMEALQAKVVIRNVTFVTKECEAAPQMPLLQWLWLYSPQVDNGNKDFYENGQLVQTSVPLELDFEPGSIYPSEHAKRFLIYCTAPPKTDISTSSDVRDWLKSNYLIWTVPFQKDVWICLLYTRVSNLDDKIVMVLAVAGMVIAWMYENMLTSSVTVPRSEEKVIENLKELVERNYKILWYPKIEPLNPLMLYESSFKAAGLSHRMKDTFIAVKNRFPDPVNDAKLIRLTSYKRAIITDGKMERYLKHLTFELRRQSGIQKSNCQYVKENFYKEPFFWYLVTTNREWLLKTLQRFNDNGLAEQWGKWRAWSFKLVSRNQDLVFDLQKHVKNRKDFSGEIVLSNMAPVYCVCFVIFWNAETTGFYIPTMEPALRTAFSGSCGCAATQSHNIIGIREDQITRLEASVIPKDEPVWKVILANQRNIYELNPSNEFESKESF
ncbi:unnamed protein product [Orchesella dallaii]|uniref:Uncharacterized protein n=1 Tax=Orchesella dallaii TaxID=48710 RepID=A0ABP1RNL2_9HEXA